MEAGSGYSDEPSAKKQRRSHHKTQLSAYCFCGRCKGQYTQKPRTIEDHLIRYPRSFDSSPEPNRDTENEQPGSQETDFFGAGPPNQLYGPPRPDHIQPQGSLLHDEAGLEGVPIDTQPPSPTADYEPGMPDKRGLASTTTMANEQDEEPVLVANEKDQDHRFDDLLNEEGDFDSHDFATFNHNLESPEQGEEGPLGLYDEDFGLEEGIQQNNNAEVAHFEVSFDDDETILELENRRDENEGGENEDLTGDLGLAFKEHPLIRNAYIDAFVQKTCYRSTHRAIKHQLKAARRTIAAHPDVPPEQISKMAQTIRTVEKRLGVDFSRILTTYTLCPDCGRRYSPEYILHTDNSNCLNLNCAGVLYAIRKLESGEKRRVSNLTYPFASPIAWLRNMLLLPGTSELLQLWRKPADCQGITPPVPCDEWIQNLDPNKPIGDIHEGWGWRSTEAGIERYQDPISGDILDKSPLDPSVQFVSLPYGLSLSMNTDWFQVTKEGNYSVGACYLVVNNMPRHMRFLRENIALCLIMPGPNEPDDYALDQMLGPLVDELLQLQKGVMMTIRRNSDPPTYEQELVHSELSQHIADLIARIKLGGGAGVRSEMNFCLYCHARLSSLSVAHGFLRQDFSFRDPQQERNNVHRWKSLPTPEERKAFFGSSGNRYTELHRLPGWNTCTSSPLDAMHLLYLGATNWIVKQVLVGPGMLTKRRREGKEPKDIFNECVDNMWLPRNFQRLPPKLGQTRTNTKADQWKLMSKIMFIPLYLAFRDGDEIGPGFVPRGNRSSPGFKHQSYRAKLLHQQRNKFYEAIEHPEDCPSLLECYPARSMRFHYRQILRFCVAINLIDKRSVTPTDIQFAQQLLELLCVGYTGNNVPLPPNFHYLMHLEEWMLKSGSIYNTHVWGMERANGIVARISHNGKGKGILEGTLMRGWWSHTTTQNLVMNLQALPNRTDSDSDVINDLKMALRGEGENTQQRGSLMTFIAQCQTAYTQKYGILDSTRLSKQSRSIDLEKHDLYDLVLAYCTATWPDAGIFGGGMARTHYLAPNGMVRNHSYVEVDGVRYGAYEHTSGKGYCYGFIDDRQAVRIDRILHIEVSKVEGLSAVCALVRNFHRPQPEPIFPWDAWSNNLGVSSWVHGNLGQLTAIPVHRFSGVFALFDITMSNGKFWVTVALDNYHPEDNQTDETD